jgi:hypothetical protein
MEPRREKAEEKQQNWDGDVWAQVEKRQKKKRKKKKEKKEKEKEKMFIVFLVQHMMVKEHKRNFWLCLLVYLDKCFFI